MASDSTDKSELRLLEISRKIQRVTQMIDSWSKAPNLNGQSNRLDPLALQKSLIIIQRLQETTKMMSLMEQKHNPDFLVEQHVQEEDNWDEERELLKFGGLCVDMKCAIKLKAGNHMSLNKISKGDTDLTMRDKAPNLIANLTSLEKKEEKNGHTCISKSVGKEHVNGKEFVVQKHLLVETALKGEISAEGHRKIRELGMRKNRASVEFSPKFRTRAFVTSKGQKKGSNYMSGKFNSKREIGKVTSAPLWQGKRTDPLSPPSPKHDKTFSAAKGGSKSVGTNQSNAYIKESRKGEKASIISNTTKTAANMKRKGKIAEGNKPTSTHISIHRDFSQKLVENSNPWFKENKRKGAKIFCESMRKMSKGQKNILSVKRVMTNYLAEAIGHQKNVKDFLTEAKQMFGFDAQTKAYQRDKFDEEAQTNAYKLMLECAKELIGRKSYQLALLSHPMSRKIRTLISLEHFMEDIGCALKKLNRFYRAAELEGDDVYYKLERDLRCKDLILNSSWDFGWISCVCVEEFDAVVNQVEAQIIFGLVVEVAIDLVP